VVATFEQVVHASCEGRKIQCLHCHCQLFVVFVSLLKAVAMTATTANIFFWGGVLVLFKENSSNTENNDLEKIFCLFCLFRYHVKIRCVKLRSSSLGPLVKKLQDKSRDV
jgi:hypothetical protein